MSKSDAKPSIGQSQIDFNEQVEYSENQQENENDLVERRSKSYFNPDSTADLEMR